MPAETINCPVCQQPMQKQDVPQGVEIDYCDAHGVWLDAGELEAIVQAEQAKPAAVAPTATRPVPSGAGASLAHTVSSVMAGAGMSALIRTFFGRRW